MIRNKDYLSNFPNPSNHFDKEITKINGEIKRRMKRNEIMGNNKDDNIYEDYLIEEN